MKKTGFPVSGEVCQPYMLQIFLKKKHINKKIWFVYRGGSRISQTGDQPLGLGRKPIV